MLEKIIDGYSLRRLGIILGIFVYLDMVTTFIGHNLGMYETNDFLRYILDFNPLLIFLHPIMILSVVYVCYTLFRNWEFELKVGYLFLSFSFAFAVVTNIMGLFL